VIPQPAARRYAEAAHLIAREGGKVDAWSDGLASLAALFGDQQAARIFADSRVPVERKRALIESSLGGADPNVKNLALLLLHRRRTALGPQIAQAFREIVDRERGIAHAVVTSAVPLSDDERRAIEKKLHELAGGEVVMSTEVDEGILGGLVVRIGDRLIDGSTRSRLTALKQRLAGARA
jgi:F-type H+-transporting ATPase subunit delta